LTHHDASPMQCLNLEAHSIAVYENGECGVVLACKSQRSECMAQKHLGK
jgi:hypothetical protein